MPTDIELIKQAVREVLEDYLQENKLPQKNESPNRCWYPTAEAYKLLNLKSARQLYEIKDRLKQGHHYRYSNRSRTFNRATYDWHIERCMEALSKDLLRK